jgi:hypothetical protein
MANTFQIKYIYDIFPDIDFTQEFVICQNIVEKEPLLEIQATEDKWGHVLDSIKYNRKIQSIKYRQYEVKIEISRNLDVSIIRRADYVSLTTSDNETFNIFDVQITYNKVPGGLNYVIEMTFKRDAEINNHLTSDNCLALKTATYANVTEIEATVDNPPFALNIGSLNPLGTIGAHFYEFEIDSNEEPLFDFIDDFINVSDYLYLHMPNTVAGYDEIYECRCVLKTTNYIYFRTNTFVTKSLPHSNLAIVMDFEPYDTVSVNVSDMSYTYNIYSCIIPELMYNIDESDGNNMPDGIQENQKFIVKDIFKFKVWVTDAELWKMEYLKYCKTEDIELTLYYNGIPYIVKSSQTKDIYQLKENNNLIDVHEFDINFQFNNKVVSYNR